MSIKATIVAYAFSVKYFNNTPILAYAGLRFNYAFGYVTNCYTLSDAIINHAFSYVTN